MSISLEPILQQKLSKIEVLRNPLIPVEVSNLIIKIAREIESRADDDLVIKDTGKVDWCDRSETFFGEFKINESSDVQLFFIDTIRSSPVAYTCVKLSSLIMKGRLIPIADLSELVEVAIERMDDGQKARKVERLGFGTRRYQLINQVCREKFQLPLHSGASNEKAQALWDRLVRMGLAEMVQGVDQGYYGAYRFKV